MMDEALPKQLTTADEPQNGQPVSQEVEELADATTQENYRQEYLLQMKRLSCPGCGEDGRLF